MLSFLMVLMGFNELQWDLMGLRLGFSSENQPTGCILKWDSRQHLLAINGIRIIIINNNNHYYYSVYIYNYIISFF